MIKWKIRYDFIASIHHKQPNFVAKPNVDLLPMSTRGLVLQHEIDLEFIL